MHYYVILLDEDDDSLRRRLDNRFGDDEMLQVNERVFLLRSRYRADRSGSSLRRLLEDYDSVLALLKFDVGRTVIASSSSVDIRGWLDK